MTDISTYGDASPRHALPFLFVGQAQKEFTVNEAFARIDMLLHPSVEGATDTPPENPRDGDVWLIADGAGGEWADRTDMLAGRQAGVWVFAQPKDGLRIYDRANGQELLYADGWRRPTAPDLPIDGETVDAELRLAFTQLVEALGKAGVFA